MTPILHELTAREEAVLAMVAEGRGHREIAFTLGISPATVRTHQANAKRKLGAVTLAQAVALFVRIRPEVAV